MTLSEKIRLGDLLLEQGHITESQLAIALEQQKQVRLRLGRMLVNNSFVTEEIISEVLAEQLGISYVNIHDIKLEGSLVKLLNENQARRLAALVLEERNGTLRVGMADPTDIKAADEIARILNRRVEVVIVTEGQLLEAIDHAYSRAHGFVGTK